MPGCARPVVIRPPAAALWLALALAAGCSHRRPAPGPALQAGQVEAGGRTRAFLFHAPPAERPLPLVIAFHGNLGTPEGMASLTGFLALAAREGFAVAFPEGIEKSWADARGITKAARAGVDDAGLACGLPKR